MIRPWGSKQLPTGRTVPGEKSAPAMSRAMYAILEGSFKEHLAVFWANLSRLNNLLIILNISMFFLTGLVSMGYFFTFFSIGCFSIVALLTIVPVARISRLWYYLLTLFFEFAGMYFLIASIVFWLQTGARLGV
jgi:hypothetical protein